MAPDTVHQCPYCELRFAYRPEVADHVAADHPRPVDEDLPATPARAGHVTVPLDPGHPPTAALPLGIAVARQAGLAVEVVAAPAAGVPTAPYLAARRRDVVGAGVASAPTVQLTGPTAPAIVAHAAAGPTRFLCLATHARGPVSERLLGSVSAHVVRHSPVPVLLAGPGLMNAGQPIRRVLVGIDGSALSRQALDVAVDLASWLGVPFDLTYVVRPTDPYAEVPDAALLWAAAHLQPPWEYDVVYGDDPAQVLAERAGSAGDTLTVVGTHGRSGLALAVLGSVALGLTRRAAGPVLVLPATAAGATGTDVTSAARTGGGT